MKMQGQVGVEYAVGRGKKYRADDEGVIHDVHSYDVSDLARSGCVAITEEVEKPAPIGDDFEPASDDADK